MHKILKPLFFATLLLYMPLHVLTKYSKDTYEPLLHLGSHLSSLDLHGVHRRFEERIGPFNFSSEVCKSMTEHLSSKANSYDTLYRPIENFLGSGIRENRKQSRNFGFFIGIGHVSACQSWQRRGREQACCPIDPSWKLETNDLNISDLSGDHETRLASLYFGSVFCHTTERENSSCRGGKSMKGVGAAFSCVALSLHLRFRILSFLYFSLMTPSRCSNDD